MKVSEWRYIFAHLAVYAKCIKMKCSLLAMAYDKYIDYMLVIFLGLLGGNQPSFSMRQKERGEYTEFRNN